MSKIKVLMSVALYCMSLTALSSQTKTVAQKTKPDSPQRIISVGGALTEIIYALNAQKRLVASDTSSYYPAAAKKLPKVGYQRNLSAEGIIALKPDLLILSAEAGPPPVIRQLQSLNLQMMRMEAGRSLRSVYNNIKRLGKKLGRKKRAKALIAKMQTQKKQLDKIIQRYKGRSPKVLFLLNHQGNAALVAGKNTAINAILKLAGLRNAVTAFQGYKPLTPEAAAASKADILLLTSISMRRYGNMQKLLQQPALKLTPAAKNKRVIVMDTALLLGFGPRVISAANELRQKSIKSLQHVSPKTN